MFQISNIEPLVILIRNTVLYLKKIRKNSKYLVLYESSQFKNLLAVII